MVELRIKLGTYMILSAFFVSWGGYLLWNNSLVPPILTLATVMAVLVVLLTAFFVFRGSRAAMNFGVILSIAAIISSLSSTAHLHSMALIFNGGLITVLDILEILGFYLFPALYIYSRIKTRNVGVKLETE